MKTFAIWRNRNELTHDGKAFPFLVKVKSISEEVKLLKFAVGNGCKYKDVSIKLTKES